LTVISCNRLFSSDSSLNQEYAADGDQTEVNKSEKAALPHLPIQKAPEQDGNDDGR
jgi:hypothetical protein